MIPPDTLQRLGEIAARNGAKKRTEFYNGSRWDSEQADLGVTLPAWQLAALVAELAAARAVVEATRSFLMSNSVSAVVMLDPLLAYDAALAHHHQTPEAV